MKYTKERHIEEYNDFHKNKYDYSLADFNDKKIKIICPIHGLFEQDKLSHKKHGCWGCSVELRSKNQSMGKDKFIEKSIFIHQYKYDYSKVDYKNNNTKVVILCKYHGEFKQIPNSHLVGNGCPICGAMSGGLKNKYNTAIFIEKAIKIHGEDKYDYSCVEYIDNNSYVNIVCNEHGKFKQMPSNHLSGQGCPKCVGKFLTKEEFIEKCVKIHGNEYDYSLVRYNRIMDIIQIICKKHGIFNQKGSNHINLKQGCPKCVGLNKTTDDFIKESKLMHGDLYDYSKSEYKLAKKHVIIICKKHGEFNQTPSHHLSGQGCPNCVSSRGEKLVNDILLKKGIYFKYHHVFSDLSNYEYDFYIPEKNICIEYDGVQHFKPVDYFGGIDSFKEQKRRDKDKDNYCLKNGIQLIRIPYTEKNVEKILEKI